jgi:hypothetical protein
MPMRPALVRILPTLILVGALAILVVVAGLAFLIQENRRTREEQAQVTSVAADKTATAVPAATAAAQAGRTADRAATQTLQAAQWATQRAADQQGAAAWATREAVATQRPLPPTASRPPVSPPPQEWPQVYLFTTWDNVPCTGTLDLAAPTAHDIALFLSTCLVAAGYGYPTDGAEIARGMWDAALTRQEADLDGDGQPELVFAGPLSSAYAAVAILDHDAGGWQSRLLLSSPGHYGGQARADVEGHRVIAEFQTGPGGSIVQSIADWDQVWIECQPTTCGIVWHAGLAYHEKGLDPEEHALFALPVVTQPDPGTVALTVYPFGVTLIERGRQPAAGCSTDPGACTSNRTQGPVLRYLYRWDGAAYTLALTETLAPLTRSWQEGAAETAETAALVTEHLAHQYTRPDGAVDEAGRQAAWAALWGLPQPGTAEYASWGPAERQLEAAAHDGRPGELGLWAAGVIGANDSGACRLSVLQRADEQLTLVGRVEAPCTANLSRLAWADVTGDGQPELLWLTVPPPGDWGPVYPGGQVLHVYAVEPGLRDLALLEGQLNGPDGAGVWWRDLDGDGTVELAAGRPLFYRHEEYAEMGKPWAGWPTARPFQVYRWDAAVGALVPGEIIAESWGE